MILIVSCLTMGVGLCSCSSGDDTAPNLPADDGRTMRLLTITDASAVSTRVAINAGTYAATWETGDKATYFNLSSQSGNLWYGPLTATPTGTPVGASASLSGDAHCGLGDYLAVIYPTVATIEQLSGQDPAYFTIALSGQKGTLEDIGDHYVYGVGQVTSVEGNTASGTISNTKGLLSLCKFTFKKEGTPVSVKTLQIGYGTNGAAGYPQTGQVSMPLTDVVDNVHVEADAPTGTPLTISLPDANPNPTGVVYVALFPGGYYDTQYDDRLVFHFTVSDGTNTYTGTKKVVLKEGKYYEVDIAVN